MASRAGSFGFREAALGFVAGALSVFVFHQLTVWGLTGRQPWSAWAPTAPLGVPVMLSIAFWGGVWGVVFALFAPRLPGGLMFYVAGFFFGAILPTLAGWTIVAFLKGQPYGPRGLWWTGPVINGVWGFGTAVFMTLLRRLAR
ncbi:MAG TPA: hypothetical protein VIL72_10865 [Beijerinckiaceae bacterium]|jgi:hypothetical protein